MPHPLDELMYAALSTPKGVIVDTPDPETLRRDLYPRLKAQGIKLKLYIVNQSLWMLKCE
jgi:hypothetical protein